VRPQFFFFCDLPPNYAPARNASMVSGVCICLLLVGGVGGRAKSGFGNPGEGVPPDSLGRVQVRGGTDSSHWNVTLWARSLFVAWTGFSPGWRELLVGGGQRLFFLFACGCRRLVPRWGRDRCLSGRALFFSAAVLARRLEETTWVCCDFFDRPSHKRTDRNILSVLARLSPLLPYVMAPITHVR
jgi:hypothetical protein